MANNKPTGDNVRKGAVRKRTQNRTKTMGESTLAVAWSSAKCRLGLMR
jgi:hypothetical protein